MNNQQAKWLLNLLLVMILTVCSRAPAPDRYASGTRVTLTMKAVSPEPFQLGPLSSQLFLDMLTDQPVQSEIGEMPALPMGTFTVADTKYLWHGNGVIRGGGRNERLWHGPYVQRLIIAVMHEHDVNRRTVQRILDTLEQDPTVANTPLQGPGQYPGGANDALHPTQLKVGDTNGWKVFEPQTNKP